MNLLEETLSAIKSSGHEPSDIMFIGSEVSGHSCTWEEFKQLADQEYQDGVDTRTVARDLTIVFFDGQRIRRDKFDGIDKTDWWEYFKPFRMPEELKSIRTLFSSAEYSETLSEIHGKEI